jgi:hypothetical protein
MKSNDFDNGCSVFLELNSRQSLQEIPVKDCGIGCKFYTFGNMDELSSSFSKPRPTFKKTEENHWTYDPNPPPVTQKNRTVFCFDHSDNDGLRFWFASGNICPAGTILLCFPRFFEDQKFVKVDPSVFPPEIQEFLNS